MLNNDRYYDEPETGAAKYDERDALIKMPNGLTLNCNVEFSYGEITSVKPYSETSMNGLWHIGEYINHVSKEELERIEEEYQWGGL